MLALVINVQHVLGIVVFWVIALFATVAAMCWWADRAQKRALRRRPVAPIVRLDLELAARRRAARRRSGGFS